MNEGKSYVPAFQLGKPLDGGAVGDVIESRAREFKPGDVVTSNFGWREYFVASPETCIPVSRGIQPLSVYLGTLGMTGMTAWAGLNLVEVEAGDVIFTFGSRRRRRQRSRATGETARCCVIDRPVRRKRSGFCGRNADSTAPSITKLVRCSNN